MTFAKIRARWIALTLAAAAILVLLYFKGVLTGHAVEVSLSNRGNKEIFATIDSTGRHGEVLVERMRTTGGQTTSPGLRIPPGGYPRSFGLAVGFFDSPTLHVWEVTAAGLADDAHRSDCTFDTVDYNELKQRELPSLHVRLKWTDNKCAPDTN